MQPFLLFPFIKMPFLFCFHSFIFFFWIRISLFRPCWPLIQNPPAVSSGALGLESKPPFLGPMVQVSSHLWLHFFFSIFKNFISMDLLCMWRDFFSRTHMVVSWQLMRRVSLHPPCESLGWSTGRQGWQQVPHLASATPSCLKVSGSLPSLLASVMSTHCRAHTLNLMYRFCLGRQLASQPMRCQASFLDWHGL